MNLIHQKDIQENHSKIKSMSDEMESLKKTIVESEEMIE
jgi:predicted translin family RNA/ssDNA-binding protein